MTDKRTYPRCSGDSLYRWTSGTLTLLVSLVCLVGCGDNVRAPTAEQIAAFEAADPIIPTIDMERINKAKLQTGPYRVVREDVLEFTMPALLHAVTEAEIKAAQAQDGKDYPFICRVSDEGTITLPAVGDLEVTGKSLGEIEANVAKAYEPYATNRPSIYARVLEYRTSKVYIAGVVEKPGVYTLRADQMTLVSLLTEAGGISEAGAALVRVLGSDASEDAAGNRGALSSGYTASGAVAAWSSRRTALSRSQETTDVSASPDSGEVASSEMITISSPSLGLPIHIPPRRPVADASHGEGPRLDELGSFDATNPQASPAMRRAREGAEDGTIVLPVVGMNIPFRDVALTEGDTVVVEPVQMPLISVLGLVRNPGNFEYPPYARYNLAQVIALAGGLQMEVDPRYATVYRLKRDGTILRLTFKLIEDEQYTERLNVSVRPGDLVAVENTPRTRTNAFVNRVVRLSVGTWVDLGDIWDDN